MSFSFNPNQNTYTLSHTNTTSATGLAYDYSNITWATVNQNLINQNLNGNTLEVQGDANFQGDVKIKGKSIVDSLERIEERLAILRPNEELEEKWDKLRGLRQAYMELEQEIREKEQIWATLKK